MGDASKLLDSIIKAPLWFFFALMIFTGVPMFDIPNLVDVGVKSDMRVANLPLALYALASTSLFLSSAAARCFPLIRTVLAAFVDVTWWSVRLRRLPDEARAVLALLENDGTYEFYYDPQSPGLNALRDTGLVEAHYVAPTGRDWGKFSAHLSYRQARFRNPGLFRQTLRSDSELIDDVRVRRYVAEQLANRRV